MIKLFAVDLDGTLLTQAGAIHPRDLDALVRIREAGVTVTIVTGRLYSGTRPSARSIGALGPVACVDGSHIVDASSDGDLLHSGLTGAEAAALREIVSSHGAACFVFAHDEIVHDQSGQPYLHYVRTWSARLVHHARVVDHPHWEHPRGVTEVVCVGTETAVVATRDAIEARLGPAVQVVAFPVRRVGAPGLWGMVVRAAGHTKGTAVEWLAKHHGHGVDEVAVVGDWLNDLPMFAVAGRSFAMGQAPAPVKEAATDVLEATAATGGGIEEAARRAGLLT